MHRHRTHREIGRGSLGATKQRRMHARKTHTRARTAVSSTHALTSSTHCRCDHHAPYAAVATVCRRQASVWRAGRGTKAKKRSHHRVTAVRMIRYYTDVTSAGNTTTYTGGGEVACREEKSDDHSIGQANQAVRVPQGKRRECVYIYIYM